MKGSPCEGKPRVCPGRCNPRNKRGAHNTVPYREETKIVNKNQNVYYQHSYALYSKRTQTAADSRGEAGLSQEERKFVDDISRRIEARKRRRFRCSGRLARKLLAFLVFFFLHGLIATFARNYQQYQTFLATQFCGFVTIMFWEDPSED